MEKNYNLIPGQNLGPVDTGFHIRSLLIDNPTGHWFFVVEANAYIAPYTLRAVIPMPGSTSVTILAQTPPGQFSVILVDQVGLLTLTDQGGFQPSPGVSLNNAGGLVISRLYSQTFSILAASTMVFGATLIDDGMKGLALKAPRANTRELGVGGYDLTGPITTFRTDWELWPGESIGFSISSLLSVAVSNPDIVNPNSVDVLVLK